MGNACRKQQNDSETSSQIHALNHEDGTYDRICLTIPNFERCHLHPTPLTSLNHVVLSPHLIYLNSHTVVVGPPFFTDQTTPLGTLDPSSTRAESLLFSPPVVPVVKRDNGKSLEMELIFGKTTMNDGFSVYFHIFPYISIKIQMCDFVLTTRHTFLSTWLNP